jgi:hypothetical protein
MSAFHEKFQAKLGEGLASLIVRCISGILTIAASLLAFLYRNNPTVLAVLVTIAVCSLLLLLGVFAWRSRVQPADYCPYCRRRTGEFIDYLPARNLTAKWHGIEVSLYKCSKKDCGKDYGKPVKPAA